MEIPQNFLDQERRNTGTTWTRNESFEKNGYLVVDNLWDPEELYHPLPKERGQINYQGSLTEFVHTPVEAQVTGSLARYSHPMYRQIHSGIRKKLEKHLGRELYNTYYYDRYYFPGQELDVHADRDACEISVTVHISTTLKNSWPIWIKSPDTYTDDTKKEILVQGESVAVALDPGDGLIYKGCERPHWREPMISEQKIEKKWWWNTVEDEPPIEEYYHQIFFHYVLADGQRAHCAWDKAK